jgi:tol-pal system protein YbgF
MFRQFVFLFLCLSLLSGLVYDVKAQYQSEYPADTGDNTEANTARLQVKISELEEQIRRLQGLVEQASFENKQLKTQIDKSNGDIQFRLTELEKRQIAPKAEPEATSTNSDKLQPVEPIPEDGTKETVPETKGKKPAAESKKTASEKFASPREHYNYAFKLLNQAKYAEAGSSFTSFTEQYPKDALVGNAYYWLGETHYVRHDYVKAADNFRQGYEAMPTGPKAGDNLLKLAMSLNALNKDKEACVVLKQVKSKFGTAGGTIKARADQEINRIGCN